MIANDQQPEISPLLLFLQQLKEPSLKTSSIRSVSTIALALGPQKCRELLVPLLGALFHQQNSECQQAILETLPGLVPYLGHKFYGYLLLEIVMDILCFYDEKEIRQAAFTSLQKILGGVDIRKAEKALYSTLSKLREEKQPRIKQLIIKMIPQIYIGVSSELQKEFMALLQSFKQDEKEETRATLARELKELIKIMPPAPESDIKALLEHLLKDKSEKVRVQLVEPVILLTQLLGEDQTVGYFKELTQDTNGKVKSELYERIGQLSQVYAEKTMMLFYQQIENFNEADQEVKNKILSKLPVLLQVYPADLKERFIMPLLKPPSSLQLKSTLAEVLCQLKDEEHLELLIAQGDNEFKLKLLNKIPTISRFCDMLASLLKHKSWRVKTTILQNIEQRLSTHLTSPTGQDFQKILCVVLDLLTDKVAVIRQNAAQLCTKIIQGIGLPVEKVMKMLEKYRDCEVWFTRLAVLQAIRNLVVNQTYLKLWELARKGINDRVATVRAETVGVAQEIAKHGVRSCLEEVRGLRDDPEEEVRKLFL